MYIILLLFYRNDEIERIVGCTKFDSITFRLFKLDSLVSIFTYLVFLTEITNAMTIPEYLIKVWHLINVWGITYRTLGVLCASKIAFYFIARIGLITKTINIRWTLIWYSRVSAQSAV